MAHDAQEAGQELKGLFGGCDVHREAEGSGQGRWK